MAITPEYVRGEIQQHIRSIVGLFASDSRKVALLRAAWGLQMPESRVKQLFYGEARRIEAQEADKIRAYVTAAGKLIQARVVYEEQCREFVEAHSSSAVSGGEAS